MIHDDHLAEALRTLHPAGVTTAQVNERVIVIEDQVYRLHGVVRALAVVSGFTFVLALLEFAYLIWAAR